VFLIISLAFNSFDWIASPSIQTYY